MVSLVRCGCLVVTFLSLYACSMQPLIDVGIEKPQSAPIVIEEPIEEQSPVQTAPRETENVLTGREIEQVEVSSLPKAAQSLLGQAQQSMDRGQTREAIAKLERASKIAPRSAEIYLRLAEAYLASNNRRSAMVFANKARSLTSDRKLLSEIASLGL